MPSDISFNLINCDDHVKIKFQSMFYLEKRNKNNYNKEKREEIIIIKKSCMTDA